MPTATSSNELESRLQCPLRHAHLRDTEEESSPTVVGINGSSCPEPRIGFAHSSSDARSSSGGDPLTRWGLPRYLAEDPLFSPEAPVDLLEKRFFTHRYVDDTVEAIYLMNRTRRKIDLTLYGVAAAIAVMLPAFLWYHRSNADGTNPWWFWLHIGIGSASLLIAIVNGSTNQVWPMLSWYRPRPPAVKQRRGTALAGSAELGWDGASSAAVDGTTGVKDRQRRWKKLFDRKVNQSWLYEYLGQLLFVILGLLVIESYSLVDTCTQRQKLDLRGSLTMDSVDSAYSVCVRNINPYVILFQVTPIFLIDVRSSLAIPGIIMIPIFFYLGRIPQQEPYELQLDPVDNITTSSGYVASLRETSAEFSLKLAFTVITTLAFVVAAWMLSLTRRYRFENWVSLQRETNRLKKNRERIDITLKAVLPDSVVTKFQNGSIALDTSANCTVSVWQIHDFAAWSCGELPVVVAEVIDDLFCHFDDNAGTAQFPVSKAKTVGDAYIVAAGLDAIELPPIDLQDDLEITSELAALTSVGSQVAAIIAFSRFQMNAVLTYRSESLIHPVSCSIGIHTGRCCGGMVGTASLWYEIFGNAVTTAVRLAAAAQSNCIVMSSECFQYTASEDTFRNNATPLSVPFSSGMHEQMVDAVSVKFPEVPLTEERQESLPIIRSPLERQPGTVVVDANDQLARQRYFHLKHLIQSRLHTERQAESLIHKNGGVSILPPVGDGAASGEVAAQDGDIVQSKSRMFFGLLEATEVMRWIKAEDSDMFLTLGDKATACPHLRSGYQHHFDAVHRIDSRTTQSSPFYLLLLVVVITLIPTVEGAMTAAGVAVLLADIVCIGLWILFTHRDVIRHNLCGGDAVETDTIRHSVTHSVAADGVVAFIIYLLPILGVALVDDSLCNGNLLYLQVLLTFISSNHVMRTPWYVGGTLNVCIAAGVIAAQTVRSGMFFYPVLLVAPIFMLYSIFNNFDSEQRRKQHFADVVLTGLFHEAAENEWRVHHELLQMLVPGTMVEIVQDKISGNQSAVINAEDVCVCLIRLDSFCEKLSHLMNNPKEALNLLESLYGTIERVIEQSGGHLEKVHTVGDHVLVAGPVSEHRAPKPPASPPEKRGNPGIRCLSKKLFLDKERIFG